MSETVQEWRPTWGGCGAPLIAETETSAKFPVGAIIGGQSINYGSGEFIYLLGVASTAVGSVVTYNPDTGVTALAVADAKGPIAVAMSANVAGQYGWYQIGGVAAAKVLASFASGAVPYLTATAGSLDDAVVAGDKVSHAVSTSAIDTPDTGLALISLQRPFVEDVA